MHGMRIDQVRGHSLFQGFVASSNQILLFTVIAISPNNNEIHIYETSTWTRVYLLTEVSCVFEAWCGG